MESTKLGILGALVEKGEIQALPSGANLSATVALEYRLFDWACPDVQGAHVQRAGDTIEVHVAMLPCARPPQQFARSFEVPIGQVAPGRYQLQLWLQPPGRPSPIASKMFTVEERRTYAALADAVRGSRHDVAAALQQAPWPQSELDEALAIACESRTGGHRWGKEGPEYAAIAQLLVQSGASAQAGLLSAARGASECVAPLVAAGASVDAGSPGALSEAVRAMNWFSVRELLAQGADPNLTDANGESPYSLTYARDESRLREIRALLREKGGALSPVQAGAFAGRAAGNVVKEGARGLTLGIGCGVLRLCGH